LGGILEQREKIARRVLEKSREKFFRYGFSRVTMEEIALECRISKKTLYQLFAGKETLLRAVIEELKREIGAGVQSIISDRSLDFAGRLKTLMSFVGLRVSQFNRPFIEDLRLYAPDLWKEIEDFRRTKVLENFGRYLQEGMGKGIFRRDINPGLLLRMYLTMIENMINPEVLSELPFTPYETFEAIVKVMFEGVLTGKARSRRMGRLLPGKKSAGGGS